MTALQEAIKNMRVAASSLRVRRMFAEASDGPCQRDALDAALAEHGFRNFILKGMFKNKSLGN